MKLRQDILKIEAIPLNEPLTEDNIMNGEPIQFYIREEVMEYLRGKQG